MSYDELGPPSGALTLFCRDGDCGPRFPNEDPGFRAELQRHVEAYLGPVAAVFDDPAPQHVRLDLLWVPPNRQRDCHTLVTSGMSDRAMSAPDDAADCLRAELMLSLPRQWPLEPNVTLEPVHGWPIAVLYDLARYPHADRTWVWWGHSFPNGDPPQPFHRSTRLCGAVLVNPYRLPHEFHYLKASSGRELHIFSVVPLHADELELKVRLGMHRLLDRFAARGVSDVLDPGRASVLAAH